MDLGLCHLINEISAGSKYAVRELTALIHILMWDHYLLNQHLRDVHPIALYRVVDGSNAESIGFVDHLLAVVLDQAFDHGFLH